MASEILNYVSTHRLAFIAGGVAVVFFITTIITLVAAFRRTGSRAARTQPVESAVTTPAEPKIAEPRVKRARLAVGDVASIWTQGIYERNSPEGKINHLLSAFAIDETGNIRRFQQADLVVPGMVEEALRHCDSAGGVAVHGAYATLVLWHAGDGRYAEMALKVASHAHLPAEQKELIRFLFQDILAVKTDVKSVPSLGHWNNPAFRTALDLYISRSVSQAQWTEMATRLPEALYPYYELELAQKLPARTIYRRASESRVFAEGLFRLNLVTLSRYLNPRRWQRIVDSDKSSRFQQWLDSMPCETESQALLRICDPAVFEKEDIDDSVAEQVESILDARTPRNWLFDGAKAPPLHLRLQYFKYFCLFAKYNEAVRCFATLGVHRHDRAQRLWYARALFLSGMEHEAWAEMSSLMADFPRDAAVLNEAGIYAHRMGRFEEAAEIFGLARSYFPDDATIAYNEAVFTEQYSRRQVEEKWSRVQKLTQPPVVEG